MWSSIPVVADGGPSLGSTGVRARARRRNGERSRAAHPDHPREEHDRGSTLRSSQYSFEGCGRAREQRLEALLRAQPDVVDLWSAMRSAKHRRRRPLAQERLAHRCRRVDRHRSQSRQEPCARRRGRTAWNKRTPYSHVGDLSVLAGIRDGRKSRHGACSRNAAQPDPRPDARPGRLPTRGLRSRDPAVLSCTPRARNRPARRQRSPARSDSRRPHTRARVGRTHDVRAGGVRAPGSADPPPSRHPKYAGGVRHPVRRRPARRSRCQPAPRRSASTSRTTTRIPGASSRSTWERRRNSSPSRWSTRMARRSPLRTPRALAWPPRTESRLRSRPACCWLACDSRSPHPAARRSPHPSSQRSRPRDHGERGPMGALAPRLVGVARGAVRGVGGGRPACGGARAFAGWSPDPGRRGGRSHGNARAGHRLRPRQRVRRGCDRGEARAHLATGGRPLDRAGSQSRWTRRRNAWERPRRRSQSELPLALAAHGRLL